MFCRFFPLCRWWKTSQKRELQHTFFLSFTMLEQDCLPQKLKVQEHHSILNTQLSPQLPSPCLQDQLAQQ